MFTMQMCVMIIAYGLYVPNLKNNVYGQKWLWQGSPNPIHVDFGNQEQMF